MMHRNLDRRIEIAGAGARIPRCTTQLSAMLDLAFSPQVSRGSWRPTAAGTGNAYTGERATCWTTRRTALDGPTPSTTRHRADRAADAASVGAPAYDERETAPADKPPTREDGAEVLRPRAFRAARPHRARAGVWPCRATGRRRRCAASTTTRRICGWPATASRCATAAVKGPPRWTLKLPAGAADAGAKACSRDEIEMLGTGREVPAELTDLLDADGCAARPSRPVATLRTARSILMLRGEEGEDLARGRRRHRVGPGGPAGRLAIPRDRGRGQGRAAAAGARDRHQPSLPRPAPCRGDQLPKVVRALGPRAVAPPELSRRRARCWRRIRPASSWRRRCAPAPAGCCWPTSACAAAKRTPSTRCGSLAAGCAAI